MTGIAASVKLDGLAPLRARLAELAELGSDLSPLMEAIGGAMADSTVLRFETETDPKGMKWPTSKRARDTGGKTLNKSGRLKASFNGGEAKSFVADRDSVEWGTNVVYAAIHQFGFDGPVVVNAHDRTVTKAFGIALGEPRVEHIDTYVRQTFMPSRPMLGVSADDLLTIEDLVAAFLEGESGAP